MRRVIILEGGSGLGPLAGELIKDIPTDMVLAVKNMSALASEELKSKGDYHFLIASEPVANVQLQRQNKSKYHK